MSQRAKLVLVVDDDVVTAALMTEMLGALGYATEVATSCVEAMNCVRCNTYDLLITDVVMPGMWGSRLAMWCEEVQPDLPVVFVSGDVFGIAHMMDKGMLALTKPVTRTALERTLSAAFDAKDGYRPRVPSESYLGTRKRKNDHPSSG